MDTFKNGAHTVVAANMVGAMCMSILYGAYLLVYPACLYVLLGRRSQGQPIHWLLLISLTAQFISVTMGVVVQEAMVFNSFVGLADKPNALFEMALYLILPTNGPLSKIGDLSFLISMAIGDAIIVWRVWILFHRHALLICLPPIITVTASTICGIIVLHPTWHGTTPEFLRHMATAAGSLGLATQVYSTSVIAWRIWSAGVISSQAGNAQSMTASYKAVLVIVIESGAIYTAFMLPLTVTYAIGSVWSILVKCLNPIVALVPTSMVILVARNRNRQFQSTMRSHVAPNANGDKQTTVQEAIVFVHSHNSTEDGAV